MSDPQHSKKHILLVEDDQEVAFVVKHALEHEQHQVKVAENGAIAIKHIQSEQFDLIITDIYMPETDGIELIQFIRSKQVGIDVIAYSGGGKKSLSDFLDVAKLLGARHVLRKPFEMKELCRIVAEL